MKESERPPAWRFQKVLKLWESRPPSLRSVFKWKKVRGHRRGAAGMLCLPRVNAAQKRTHKHTQRYLLVAVYWKHRFIQWKESAPPSFDLCNERRVLLPPSIYAMKGECSSLLRFMQWKESAPPSFDLCNETRVLLPPSIYAMKGAHRTDFQIFFGKSGHILHFLRFLKISLKSLWDCETLGAVVGEASGTPTVQKNWLGWSLR